MRKAKTTKPTSSEEGVKYTVCGEWFPETYPARGDECVGRGEEDLLGTEMRLFCACTRWAFNRLLEGNSREEIKKQGQEVFGLNSRFCDDAILKAREVIASQKELLAIEIRETEAKLARAEKKLDWAQRSLTRAAKAGDVVRIQKAKCTAHGRKARVKKLGSKLAELQAHCARGTIPKVVFGGRSLWKRVCKGKATRKEWRYARQNRLYARGDATKGGNPNLKVSFQDGEFTLSVVISHLSKQTRVDSKARPVMTRAPRVRGRLWLPEKHRLKTWELLLSGAPYTVELVRDSGARYRVYITFTTTAPKTLTDPNRGYLGMDTNPDGVALANTSHTGQPEPWPEGFAVPYPKALHKFAGEFQVTAQPNGFLYVRIPELAYARGHRRTYLVGVLAKVVVDIARSLCKPLAVEHLDFGKDRLDTNRRFNRMAVNFPFQKTIEAVMRRAFKEGVGVKLVSPAHTSTIGYWKYMQQYGISIHHAAALVIARRAQGFTERVTIELVQKVQAVREKLGQEENSLPGEGKGMTRKVKRLLRRLDGKALGQSGLSSCSVWRDLRQLALSSR